MNSTNNGNYPGVFHIGIPKTGTRTIQYILKNDPRVCLIRSRYFSTPEYWDESFRCAPESGQIVILSEENLVTHNMNLGQIYLTLFHIRECNPNAHIIVTIREQRSMLISRFKYNFPYWHGFSMPLEAWLRTSEGMDYLGISMYSALFKTIVSFFPEKQIHFLLFEELMQDQNSFMSNFYSLLGLSYEVSAQAVHKNRSFTDPELMFLAKINKFKLFRKGGKNFPVRSKTI